MSDKLARGYLFWFVLFWLTAAAYAWHEYNEHEPERNCEQSLAFVLAFEQCLKFRPTCTSVEVEKFMEYHESKKFIRESCPEYEQQGFK